MGKATPNRVRIPIINDQWAVVFCWGTPDDVADALDAWGYPDPKDNAAPCFDGHLGVTFHSPGCPPVIAMPCRPRSPQHISVLAHEAVHAVEDVFASIGEPRGTDSEIFAHSVGAVVRGALEFSRRSK
jgi:hypothetical protein